jgi:glucose/mannose-6-phosphate isomerase
MTARTIGTSSARTENQAKQLADVVMQGEPCIYGSSNTRSIVRRFKTALNENAKMHAFCDYSPELFHNEVEAWERPEGGLRPIFLRRVKEPPFEAKSLDIFAAMLERAGVPTHAVRGLGDGNLAQLMCLCYVTDFASYYAAILRGFDPFPVNLIDQLKKSR